MSQPAGTPNFRILIAEDHLIARVGVKTIINMQPDMKVVAEAANGVQAVELLSQASSRRHADGRAHAGDERRGGHRRDSRRVAQSPHHRVEHLWRR